MRRSVLEMTRQESGDKPVVLRIVVEPSRTLDDVIAIARTEGRKKFGCDVDLVDIDRRSDKLFWVEVKPRRKYQGLDVEASKMA